MLAHGPGRGMRKTDADPHLFLAPVYSAGVQGFFASYWAATNCGMSYTKRGHGKLLGSFPISAVDAVWTTFADFVQCLDTMVTEKLLLVGAHE